MTDSPSIAPDEAPAVAATPSGAPARAPIAIPDRIRTFLTDALRFVTLATADPDGTPRQAVIWYTLDGDEIVLNSRVGRRWPTNLSRDPRASLAVSDGADGYRWVGMTGQVRALTDPATTQADIAGMARRYHADDPAKAERLIRKFESQDRITFRFRPDAIHDHLDDD
jgi:PPOX class probable F420-dependent enzyme